MRKFIDIMNEGSLPPGYAIHTRWTGGGAYAGDAGWWADYSEDDDPEWPFPGEMLEITITYQGRVVASGDCTLQSQAYGGNLAMFNVWVDDDHRRRGLATALYDKAEEEFGEPIRPYDGGNEGGGIVDFWKKRIADRNLQDIPSYDWLR